MTVTSPLYLSGGTLLAQNESSSKYTRLLSNAALFGISTFSSKVLSFLLTRLYTSVLAQASFGIVDLVTACANLLIPLVSLGISNAVIRFGLEKGVAKKSVYTGGLIAICGGFLVLLAFTPLLVRVPLVADHLFLLCVYVLVSCLRTLNCQFVRAKMYTRLYAIDGILSTLYTIGFNFLFLVGLKMGAEGYLLSIICADALSAVGLFFLVGLRRYIRLKNVDWAFLKQMLRYSLPLVPALMFWWVTNASDRFFISYLSGPAENGLYAAAYKVPSIVTIFSTIFTEAWQLSAVTDGRGLGRERFFSNVFASLSGVAFVIGGGLIYSCRLVMSVLVAEDYYSAWQYIPFLVCAMVFSAMSAFLNSVYMVEKRSARSLFTMLAGAASNIALNALFIPGYGPNGAALATFFSYVLVFLIRAIDTRRFMRIQFGPLRLLANTALLAAAAFLMIADVKPWPLWVAIPFALLIALNAGPLARGVSVLLERRRNAAG